MHRTESFVRTGVKHYFDDYVEKGECTCPGWTVIQEGRRSFNHDKAPEKCNTFLSKPYASFVLKQQSFVANRRFVGVNKVMRAMQKEEKER